MEFATFANGCFWCTETVFLQLKGVEKVISGYTGGNIKNPCYKEVCQGITGYAEAVHIIFDECIISYVELLEIFFATHDPTTLNKQGYDIGTQYRSAIFYHSNKQKQEAIDFINRLEKEAVFNQKIVTEITKSTVFYKAEKEHQDFYKNNTAYRYCSIVINPKLEKLKKDYQKKLK